jgi:hypothetical protein
MPLCGPVPYGHGFESCGVRNLGAVALGADGPGGWTAEGSPPKNIGDDVD